MQLDWACLSPVEKLDRMRAGECLYYGQSGHFFATCPGQKTRLTSSSGSTSELICFFTSVKT